MSMPTTRDRVPAHTAESVNERIDRDMRRRVAALAARPQGIAQRLEELDAEWDIERAIEANAATLALAGTILGYFAHPAWLILPALVTIFLLQHALQGWCPPVPVLRRFGFRTVYEIDHERYALKALRGDFAAVAAARDASGAAIEAAALRG
jgi:hypothetical protein